MLLAWVGLTAAVGAVATGGTRAPGGPADRTGLRPHPPSSVASPPAAAATVMPARIPFMCTPPPRVSGNRDASQGSHPAGRAAYPGTVPQTAGLGSWGCPRRSCPSPTVRGGPPPGPPGTAAYTG